MRDEWPHFSRSEWLKLPLALRQKWWRETNYGLRTPTPELLEEIRAALDATNTEGSAQAQAGSDPTA